MKQKKKAIKKAPKKEIDFSVISEKLFDPKASKGDNHLAEITHFLQSDKKEKNFSKKPLKNYLNGLTETIAAEDYYQYNLDITWDVPFPPPKNPKFTFIDLFAGIGGFRIAMQKHGGKCVFTSEWDREAQKTYRANFGEVPFGDITNSVTKNSVPSKFDLLCGGFPCQPFSLAGVVKKNSLGRKHGFEDEKQGNLFFHVAEIIEKHRPKAFFLENVKNLISHDKGNTFKIIKETLESYDYSFDWKVLDGKNFVPQHRERTFMVGFDKKRVKKYKDFCFPEMPKERLYNLSYVLQNRVDKKYTLSDKLWQYLQAYAKKHKEQGNGFGFGLVDPKDKNATTRTISARYYKDGAEVLIAQKNKNPRRLMPIECALLQGYPEHFQFPVSDNQAYKQCGNSVVVPLIEAIGGKIIEVLDKE